MSTSASSVDKKLIFKWVISIVVSLVPFLFSVNDVYTVQVQRFLAVSILGIMVLAFELLNGVAVGFLLPLLWVLGGVCDFAMAFSSWTNSTIMMMIAALMFVQTLMKVGLLDRIGYWCIVKAKGSFTSVIWTLYFATIAVNAVGFTMTGVLCYALAFAIYKSMDLKLSSKEAIVLVWTAALGGILSITYLYCPITTSLLSNVLSVVAPDVHITWYTIMFYESPSFIIGTFMVWLGLKWYKVTSKKDGELDVEGTRVYFEEKYRSLGKMTTDEKKATVLLSFVTIYLCTQSFHGLDAALIFMAVNILSFMPGINIANSNVVKNVSWDSIFTVASFLTIGTIATALGLNAAVSNAVIPLVASMGEYWSVLGTYTLGGLVNFILSPFAMMAVLPGPIAQYCMDIGYNVAPHIYALYLSKDVVFFPYEYPAYLLLFSFGMVKMGDMIKIASVKSIILTIGFIILVMPFWHFLGMI